METYTEKMINNKSAQNRAKSTAKKDALINEIFYKHGIKLSRSLSIKKLTAILGE